ncbi:MAG: histidine phosphatase family protein [Lachnospiraceae bacterium]
MRLLMIRHGDPNYEKDSLTEKGWREAECLADKLEKMKIDYCYVSPLGRAKDTASVTLQRTGWKAQEMDWMREFEPRILRPDLNGNRMIAWDWLPQDWTKDERFYDSNRWLENEIMQEAGVPREIKWVQQGFDDLLKQHGYERDGHLYRAVKPNNDTIALFCHFGVGCVMISHLLGISPMVLWQGFCAAPTSITTIHTEERRRGIASFRMASYGDISHLYAAGEEVSFAARFCECYDNLDERHD